MKIDGKRAIAFIVRNNGDSYSVEMADTENRIGDGYKKITIDIYPENIDRIAGLVTNDKYAFVGYGNKYNDNVILNYVIKNSAMLKSAGRSGVKSCIDTLVEQIINDDEEAKKAYKYVTLFNSVDMKRFLFSSGQDVSLRQYVVSSNFRSTDKESDVDNIANIMDTNRERIEARLRVEDMYNEDLFDGCEGVIGNRLIQRIYSKMNGIPIKSLVAPTRPVRMISFKDIISGKITFKSEQLKMLLDDLSSYNVGVSEPWTHYVAYKDLPMLMNLAGLRMNTGPTKMLSDDDGEVYNVDVTSFYPSIASLFGFFPSCVNSTFMEIFFGMLAKRVSAKKTDAPVSRCMKDMLNGIIGQYMIEGSWLYDPEASYKIRVNGALVMLELIEDLYDGFDVKCVTIDGMFVKSRRKGSAEKLRDIVDGWSSRTGLNAEITENKWVYMLSNNDYISDTSRKGFFCRSENNGFSNIPNIVREAVINKLVNGVPVETTVSNGTDIRDYITSVSSNIALEWHGEIFNHERFYYSNDERMCKVATKTNFGDPELIPVTESGVTIVTTMPETMPNNVNYMHYMSEANNIVEKINAQQLKLF